MLGMRYKQTASMGDLDRAVSITSEAVDATPSNHPERAAYLIDLGHMLSMRYKQTASMDDLNRAVSIARVAVDATPPNHPGRAGRLSNLGNMLSMRYKQTASMNDLNRAVSIAREAVAATPSNHPGLHVRLSNLQDMLRKRPEQIRPIDDPNRAASIAVNRHLRLLGTPATTRKWRGSMKYLDTRTRNVNDVESLISGAPVDDVGSGKYDSGGWDVDSEKSEKGADFEETDLERKPDQLDAIELEAENVDWDRNTVETTQSLTFDHDLRSGGTWPSTVPTSHPGMKGQRPRQVSAIPEAEELEIKNRREVESTNAERLLNSYPLAEEETEEQQHVTDDCDVGTTYSVDTLLDEPKLRYLQAFAEQLAKDMKQISDEFCFGSIEAECLVPMLREFAWKLHSESSNPFQWEASVIIHKKLKNIIELLVPRPLDHDVIGSQDSESKLSEDEDQDEFSYRAIFRKSRTTVMQWVCDVGTLPYAGEELGLATEDGSVQDDIEHEHGSKEPLLRQAHSLEILPQLPDYEQFIRVSDAYQWLLTKIRQHGLLTFQAPNTMLEIGTKIRNLLRGQEPLRKMSSRKPLSMVKMTFYFDWNLYCSMRDAHSASPCEDALGRMVCLTGSWNEAQATIMKDYMDQTWPRSGALIALMQTLLSTPEGQECSYQVHESISSKHKSGAGAARLTACVQSPSVCCISVTGSLYFVSEISEQIGWLASVLQSSSDHHCPVACTPSVNDLRVNIQDEGSHGPMVVGSCYLSLNLETADISELSPGFCWSRLFHNPVLVRGYPILRRTQPNTGLEMSLANMAAIIGSQQVVRWGERMIIKGFNMLMIATLAAADIIVWHLLVSEQPEERISYIDPRLDALGSGAAKGIPLRMLEERRHVIGWCSKVTDLCGDATANLNIKSSGLREPPASIVIDRLYIEARADFGAGLNMSFNQKEKPFWLMRENDYPSLLKWVGIQPIVFYDVADRRAWLTDGASALLHLVRVSLYLDENDPESVYDWVFDATQLKDKWHGFTGRQAALKTLKSWDNLNLNVYVVCKQRRSEGGFETEYATLETRVKKILHSIEILIDKQAMNSSQDGIRIPQTLDIRRDIIGYDIQDIIDPCSAIRSRIKHIDSWGHGWVDLIPSIGTTTIFGRGFGDLISPEEPHALCSEWKSVPKGRDYMASSVATLQMLYKQRLLREEPGLSPGEMTSKIVWVSPNHPFKSCECLQRSTSNTEDGDFHTDSVQFLIAKKSFRSRLMLRGSAPVDVMALDEKGAVVFGHIAFLSRKSEGKFAVEQQDEDLDAASSVALSSRETLRSSLASPATSESIRSAGSTTITSPSLKASLSVEIRGESNSPSDSNDKSDKKGKGWMGFMKFLR
ncbi:hypothetical protein T069G_09157 [Trichoderma breve]|uniref:Uncharacterized protein n=1 Tax=Trichoderma breve TaxID=2034170 RepID=A0A9W9B6Y7_9HYPO|nr:hypothetical protein T069G_09157 [Trichoderma breve]KAJ4855789.1 hypothetical protein T069G_09157 [Trichoderma breve]